MFWSVANNKRDRATSEKSNDRWFFSWWKWRKMEVEINKHWERESNNRYNDTSCSLSFVCFSKTWVNFSTPIYFIHQVALSLSLFLSLETILDYKKVNLTSLHLVKLGATLAAKITTFTFALFFVQLKRSAANYFMWSAQQSFCCSGARFRARKHNALIHLFTICLFVCLSAGSLARSFTSSLFCLPVNSRKGRSFWVLFGDF